LLRTTKGEKTTRSLSDTRNFLMKVVCCTLAQRSLEPQSAFLSNGIRRKIGNNKGKREEGKLKKGKDLSLSAERSTSLLLPAKTPGKMQLKLRVVSGCLGVGDAAEKVNTNKNHNKEKKMKWVFVIKYKHQGQQNAR